MVYAWKQNVIILIALLMNGYIFTNCKSLFLDSKLEIGHAAPSISEHIPPERHYVNVRIGYTSEPAIRLGYLNTFLINVDNASSAIR